MHDSFPLPCLAIETSAEPASLALQKTRDESTTCSFPNENKANVSLFSQLEALQPQFGTLKTILVGLGPGSYSGARVGLAAAQALGMSDGCSVIGLPSVTGIGALHGVERGVLVGDARRGAYFLVETRFGRPLHAPRVIPHEELTAQLSAYPSTTDFMTFEDVARLSLPGALQERVARTTSSAEGLIQFWQGLSGDERAIYNAQSPEVQYLRPPHITKAKNPF